MLSASKIYRRIGKTEILKDVSIAIEPRKPIAVAGPSGCGKSTLLRVLSLLDFPDTGTISIDDAAYQFPANGWERPDDLYPKISIVFQQLFLWPHLTNLQNLALPLGRKTEDGDKIIKAKCEDLEITEQLPKFPNESSLGQKQRVALARALILSPNYLLCDEITSAQDSKHRAMIVELLREFCSNGGGLLVVTHDLQFANELGADILKMEDGRILNSK